MTVGVAHPLILHLILNTMFQEIETKTEEEDQGLVHLEKDQGLVRLDI